MATQRIKNHEKTYLDNDGKGASEPSNIAPAVPASVIWTLLSFTFAMITLPIGTYFFVVNLVFVGNSTFAGALAAVMANVVLIAYVIMAMKEDQTERREEEERQKKSL
ncbi:vacuolar ATPase assembly integral membrane protein VMA21 [Lophiostoma macrostomum CBS 122681]|uniref:Vacuolar ATPase assembly integral membrane protein VMA21 n=1 Tax=Lophiostoma macrostomum CBS 122681 TaxID=1314788 RepID=A0A6A6TRR7_9PLEO|nr:vacuolar ATPase assembly integral membrane protein VMA21 [Lophiostoma macrostomum CBS 122681]